jgi:ribosomal protein L12E/L44/L45/RPP1/RPP2
VQISQKREICWVHSLNREAKLAAKELGENVVVSPESPVNDQAYQADMNAKFEQHEAAEKKVKKEKKSKKTVEESSDDKMMAVFDNL